MYNSLKAHIIFCMFLFFIFLHLVCKSNSTSRWEWFSNKSMLMNNPWTKTKCPSKWITPIALKVDVQDTKKNTWHGLPSSTNLRMASTVCQTEPQARSSKTHSESKTIGSKTFTPIRPRWTEHAQASLFSLCEKTLSSKGGEKKNADSMWKKRDSSWKKRDTPCLRTLSSKDLRQHQWALDVAFSWGEGVCHVYISACHASIMNGRQAVKRHKENKRTCIRGMQRTARSARPTTASLDFSGSTQSP